ncbi:MAG: calcium-binding protein, partial [Pseudomonadota bacterium]
DELQGSAGDDMLSGDDGDDAVQGGLDNDTLDGGMGADSLFGGWGDDVVNGVVDDATTEGLSDIDGADFLNGGSDNDVIIAGAKDIVTAGDGQDTIVAGDWIEEGETTEITDFDAEDDNILLVYDDDADVPDVSLQPDPETPGTMLVMMDGVAVASVTNGAELSLDDIAVMPLSMAQAAGMAPL